MVLKKNQIDKRAHQNAPNETYSTMTLYMTEAPTTSSPYKSPSFLQIPYLVKPL